jgi:type VI secretion system secreted protein VgrG
VSSVAAEAANLYAHEGGIQAIAGNGPVSLQAHTDGLEILADKEVVVISVNDSIEIKAKQKIVLQAGQSSITLEGGNITFACPGEFSVKGSQHIFDAGASRPALLPGLPAQLTTMPMTAVEKSGPHAITVMAYSAEGEALTDAKVSFFDPVAKSEFAKGDIDGTGGSAEVSADYNRPYHALVGYEGWTAHFEEVGDETDDDDYTFDPGELDEDRDTEHL